MEKSKRCNVENLKPWRPGQSGNPEGRPKSHFARACRELLAKPVPDDPEGHTYAEKIAEVMAERAIAGDIRAAQELADRAEGKPRQAIEIERSPLAQAFDRMSREELEAYACTGLLPDWFEKEQIVQ